VSRVGRSLIAGFPLAASIAAHGALLALLIVLVGQVPAVRMRAPTEKAAVEIMFAPPEPVAETPPSEPPQTPATEPLPLEQLPPVVEAEPPPRPATPEPAKPPPRPKPAVKRPPPPVRLPPPEPPSAPMQAAALPKPPPSTPPPTPPGPVVNAGYRAALGAWLESHKHYPDGARARGEEGRAVLRFHVDRLGRVLNYAVVQGTGYPDLDAAIDQMMRGASLPPFPGDMSALDVDVSVTIRFALTH
jgi:periplasmic protein TonB